MKFRQTDIFNKKFFITDRSRPNSQKIGMVILIIASFFILNLAPVSKQIKEFFHSTSSPIQRWFWERGNGISDFFEMIFEMKKIKEENDDLKFKNQELVVKIVELEHRKKENEILRTALGIDLQKDFNLEISQVIGKDISGDFLIINKGYTDDMVLDLPVITQQKSLIGKISEVYKNTSKVQLLTAKDSSFDVEIFEKEVYGLAQGRGNFNIWLELIPRDKEIRIEDKIITSALGGNFPGGLLVGEIYNVKKSDITSFQEAEIRPLFNIKDLKYLFIIMNFGS